ncbi:MAG: lytic transglycosylase domain-containing protein [Myxococcales bacterium]|nr:lytic transglycosylase domain-containing protein [Myxococcales bacterium]
MWDLRPGTLRVLLFAAGLVACRPGAVSEAAQRVHPAVNVVHGAPPAPAPVASRPAPAQPSAAAAEVPAADDAATLLARGKPEEALALLAERPAAAAGTPEWFVQSALRGRAERLRGRPAEAVAALEPIYRQKGGPVGLPRELVADELARSLVALAATLPVKEADAKRREALAVWQKAMKMEPVRNLAPMRVAHAETLAAIEGEGASRRAAAAQAVKALTAILKQYPQHPRVGSLALQRALALGRAGKKADSISELREVAMGWAGSPEAEAAEQALAGAGAPVRWSAMEQVDRAAAARHHRKYDYARAVLDDLLREPGTPGHVRTAAQRQRAWTASKQRDFKTCAADFEAAGADRDDLLRCLDKAERYDDALALLKPASEKKGAAGKAGLMAAIDQAIKAGRYSAARGLLDKFSAKDRSRGERQWLDAWLKYRLGEREAAIEAFKTIERHAKSERAVVARYFRGRLLLAAPEGKSEGAAVLRKLMTDAPLDYYGLMARQRLIDAGVDPGPAPALTPVPTETTPPPDAARTRATFAALAGQFGKGIPALPRAAFLEAAGWRDEAQRELRIAVDVYEDLTPGTGHGWVPHHEDYVRGLSWLASWKQPRLPVPREARKLVREPGAAQALREGLHTLTRALDEPHRAARLTPAHAHPYKSRWHPRAFRPVVEREAAARSVDPSHLWALMYTESRFRKHVVSSAGARGAIQIMPNTGELLAGRLGETLPDVDLLFEIDTNVHLSAYYLAELLHKFHGQAAMAYASYNGGPYNVERWLKAKADRAGGGQPLELDVFIAEIPIRETANYTRRVLEVQAAYYLLYKGELPRWTNAVDAVVEANIDF